MNQPNTILHSFARPLALSAMRRGVCAIWARVRAIDGRLMKWDG